jgi:uncharacterized protein
MKEQSLGGRANTFLLVLEPGEEVMTSLEQFARTHDVGGASFTGIGAFESAVLAFFDLDRREYDRIPVSEQVEVLSITGNIGRHNGEPLVHAHAVIGMRDGASRGGHVLEGHVRPTLEITLTVVGGTIVRRKDPGTGLPLISPGG